MDASIKLQQIGIELEMKGIQDEDIIRFLHTLKGSTFFSWDSDFYQSKLLHSSYCLVFLDCPKSSITDLIKIFLKLDFFDTKAKRMGKVIKLSTSFIKCYELGKTEEQTITW